MAEDFNLLDLQRSSKQIRNPFGFDFHYTWGGQPYVFKGTGKNNGLWQSLLGPLADLTANHLFQLIVNKYHDEQTEPLKLEGKYDAARKYRVPADVEDTIWELITGEKEYPRKKGNKKEIDVANQKANLSVLKGALNNLKAEGRKARAGEVNEPANISGLIARAQKEIGQKNIAAGDTDHESGTAQLDGSDVPDSGVDESKELDAGQISGSVTPDETPASAEDLTPGEDTEEKAAEGEEAGEKEEVKDEGFGDLDQLDDEEEPKK